MAVIVGSTALAQVVGVPAGGSSLGAPFRPNDGGRAMAGLAPSYEEAVQQLTDARAMTPDALEATLRARGFSGITNLKRRGGAYVCEATGPRRERVRLVLDAMSGEISGVQVIGFAGKTY